MMMLWWVLGLIAAVAAGPHAINYDVLETKMDGETRISTVRADMQFSAGSTIEMKFLLSGNAIMGAQFTDESIRDQAVYPGFAIMQSSLFLDRKLERALQIGLGVGTVPTFLRQHGVPTDAIELSKATVEMATKYFEYEDCRDSNCPRGWTRVMDGLEFLQETPSTTYSLIIIDVYTGYNVIPFYTIETLSRIKQEWLKGDGVVVMNFVGYYNEPNMDIVHAIHATLQSVFEHVRVFREMAANDLHEPANLVFYASDNRVSFSFPKGFENPPPGYYEALVKFENWEMLADSIEMDVNVDGTTQTSVKAEALTTATDFTQFKATHDLTVAFMESRCKELLPTTMWDELQSTSTTQ